MNNDSNNSTSLNNLWKVYFWWVSEMRWILDYVYNNTCNSNHVMKYFLFSKQILNLAFFFGNFTLKTLDFLSWNTLIFHIVLQNSISSLYCEGASPNTIPYKMSVTLENCYKVQKNYLLQNSFKFKKGLVHFWMQHLFFFQRMMAKYIIWIVYVVPSDSELLPYWS